jgi:hypothetical protein
MMFGIEVAIPIVDERRLKRSPERSEWILISESFLIFEPATAVPALFMAHCFIETRL